MLRMDNRIAINSALGKSIGNGTNNRNFTTLDGVADYYTIPTVTLTADFSIEAKVSLTELTKTAYTIIGGTTGGDNMFRIDAANGGIDFQINNRFKTNDGQFTADGKYHDIKLERVGTTINAYYDGVLVNTETNATYGGNAIFEEIGAKGSAQLFNGIISDIKITDGTDLIRYYKIDEDLSTTTTIVDNGSDGSNGSAVSITSSELFTLVGADWLGSEIVTNGNFATDSDWTKGTGWSISGGTAIDDGSGNFTSFTQSANLPIVGYAYKKSFEIISFVGGVGVDLLSERLGIAVANNYRLADGVGVKTSVFICDGTIKRFLSGATGRGSTIDNVSVKRILQAPLTAEEILTDGSTVLWVDAQQNITKDGSDLVSNWGDKSGNGNDLVQATATNQPLWSANGILFDGVDNFMKAVAFTLVQPEFIYIVFKQVTWTSSDRIFDGNTASTARFFQGGVSPALYVYAGGATSSAETNLTLDTYGIARVKFNGASSTFQINEFTQITGNFGANNMGGFTLGADGNNLNFSNAEVKEVIIRNTADDAFTEGTIYNYLANKYSI